MKTLLFEIGTEELPARFLSLGLAQLAQKAEELFKARIDTSHQTYGTPEEWYYADSQHRSAQTSQGQLCGLLSMKQAIPQKLPWDLPEGRAWL